MRKLIKDGRIVEDSWILLPKQENPAECDVPAGDVIVPLAVWQAQSEKLAARERIGVWIDSDEEVETIGQEARRFAVIGVNFPSFRDGRNYSTARLLRERYDYTGEIRAIGDVLQDQLFYMSRCGINAFAVREDRDIEKALAGLKVFSESYQAAWDQPSPLFRRRQQQSPQRIAMTA